MGELNISGRPRVGQRRFQREGAPHADATSWPTRCTRNSCRNDGQLIAERQFLLTGRLRPLQLRSNLHRPARQPALRHDDDPRLDQRRAARRPTPRHHPRPRPHPRAGRGAADLSPQTRAPLTGCRPAWTASRAAKRTRDSQIRGSTSSLRSVNAVPDPAATEHPASSTP